MLSTPVPFGKQAASARYKAAFSDVPAAGVDGGYIQNYNAGGDTSSATKQMHNAFENWNIPTMASSFGGYFHDLEADGAAMIWTDLGYGGEDQGSGAGAL